MGIARCAAGTSRESFVLISENPSSYPKISGIPAQIAFFGIWRIRDTDISSGEKALPHLFFDLKCRIWGSIKGLSGQSIWEDVFNVFYLTRL